MCTYNFTTISRFLLISLSFFPCVEKLWCSTIDFQKDSIEIRNILESAKSNALKNFPKAIVEVQNALSLALKLNDNKLIFMAYRTQADIHESNNHLNEAAACYEKALALQDFVSVSNK